MSPGVLNSRVMTGAALAVEEGRRCAAHGAPSIDACARCGSFICADCRRWQAERPICAECRARLGDRPSAQASLALGLATLGFVTILPGIVAIALARRELARIAALQSSDAGESHARLARNLGYLQAVAALVLVALLVLRWS